MEQLGEEERMRVINNYSQKLLKSGYNVEQVRRIIINGIRGFEGRKKRCEKEGRRLYRTARESQGARERKKLISKLNWNRSEKKPDYYADERAGSTNSVGGAEPKGAASRQFKSVLFIEHTPDGELAKRLREVLLRLSPVMGFTVKVVERNGGALQNKFQQSS